MEAAVLTYRMILSVAIVTKDGTPLVARQFNRLTRTQVEGHLGAFPKLLSKSNQSYIETENIRYVYQELGEIYFILITSKDSNILEDLDLLALLVDLTRETLDASEATITAESVLRGSLELVFAYDECIFDGYRQNVTINDVETFLKMESKDELEYLREKKAKEDKAKTEMNEKMVEIAKMKKANKANMSAVSGGSGAVSSPVTVVSETTDAGMEERRPKPARRPMAAGKGMTLGKKVSARDRAQQMILEEGLTPSGERERKTAEVARPAITGVDVQLTEECTATRSKVGVVKELSVQGKLTVCSSTKQTYFLQVGLGSNANKFKMMPVKQPQRRLFQQAKQLQFDNASPGNPLTILGWRMTSTDASDLPLSITCWVPDPNAQPITFSCEIEKTGEMDLAVEVSIPVYRPRNASVSQCDGEHEILERDNIIKWYVPELNDGNTTAAIEFSVPNGDPDSFYPITVAFKSTSLYCDIEVESVADSLESFDSPAKYEVMKSLVGDVRVE